MIAGGGSPVSPWFIICVTDGARRFDVQFPRTGYVDVLHSTPKFLGLPGTEGMAGHKGSCPRLKVQLTKGNLPLALIPICFYQGWRRLNARVGIISNPGGEAAFPSRKFNEVSPMKPEMLCH